MYAIRSYYAASFIILVGSKPIDIHPVAFAVKSKTI